MKRGAHLFGYDCNASLWVFCFFIHLPDFIHHLIQSRWIRNTRAKKKKIYKLYLCMNMRAARWPGGRDARKLQEMALDN